MPRNNLWLSLALGQDPRQNAQQGPQQPRLAPELGALDQNAPRSRQLAARDSLLARPMPNQSTLHDNSWTGRSLQLWDTQVSALRNLDPVQKAEHWGNLALGIAAGAGFGGSATPALNTFNLPEVQPTDFWPATPAAPGRIGPNPGDVGGVTSNHALTAQQSWLRQQAATLPPGALDRIGAFSISQAGVLPPETAVPQFAIPEAPLFPSGSENRPVLNQPLVGGPQVAPGDPLGLFPAPRPVREFPGRTFEQYAPGHSIKDGLPESISNPYLDDAIRPITTVPGEMDHFNALHTLWRLRQGLMDQDLSIEQRMAVAGQLDPALRPDKQDLISGLENGDPINFPTNSDRRSPNLPKSETSTDRFGRGGLEFGDAYETYMGTNRDGEFGEHPTLHAKLTHSALPSFTGSWATSKAGKRYNKDNRPIFSQSTTHARPKQLMSDPDDTYETHEPKPATIDGARYIDREFVGPSQLQGKKLLNLEQPLPGPIAAQVLERLDKNPTAAAALKALGSDPKRLTALLHQHRLGANSAIIGALRSGTFPIDAPARFNIDLLNALSPGNQLGHRFLLQQGYHGGTGNLARYALPKVPGMARAAQTNRHYLRLWDAPPKPEIPQPAEVSGQPKRPFDMAGQPDAGGIPWDRRGFNSDRLFNPRTDEEAQHNIKRLGQALSVGRHFVPEFAKRSLVPPEIRGVLHFLGGSGKPTDLGLTPADFEGVGVAPITFSGDMVPALKNASRRLVEHDPAIKRETLIPWVPNPNAVGDAHAYSKLFNTFGKGFFTPEGHAVDDYRFYPNVVETSPRSAYHTSLQELRDALKTHMAPTASLADELFVNRGRPYKLEVRNAIQPQEIELWPNMLDIMQDARARGRHARDYWRSALPQDISDEEDAAITAAFKAQLQNEDPDFDF